MTSLNMFDECKKDLCVYRDTVCVILCLTPSHDALRRTCLAFFLFNVALSITAKFKWQCV